MKISLFLLFSLMVIDWFSLCANSYAATLQTDEANIQNDYRPLFVEALVVGKTEASRIEKNLGNNPAVLKKDGNVAFAQVLQDPYIARQKKIFTANRRPEQQEVISILEITKTQVVNLLEDEQIDDIKLVTAELNRKLNNLNEKINQGQWFRTDFMLLDSLFPNEDVGGGGYQATFSSTIANKHSSLNNHFLTNPQVAVLNPGTDLQDGVFGFILKIPYYIFDLKNLFFLSLAVLMVIGFFKGLRFFLNNTW